MIYIKIKYLDINLEIKSESFNINKNINIEQITSEIKNALVINKIALVASWTTSDDICFRAFNISCLLIEYLHTNKISIKDISIVGLGFYTMGFYKILNYLADNEISIGNFTFSLYIERCYEENFMKAIESIRNKEILILDKLTFVNQDVDFERFKIFNNMLESEQGLGFVNSICFVLKNNLEKASNILESLLDAIDLGITNINSLEIDHSVVSGPVKISADSFEKMNILIQENKLRKISLHNFDLAKKAIINIIASMAKSKIEEICLINDCDKTSFDSQEDIRQILDLLKSDKHSLRKINIDVNPSSINDFNDIAGEIIECMNTENAVEKRVNIKVSTKNILYRNCDTINLLYENIEIIRKIGLKNEEDFYFKNPEKRLNGKLCAKKIPSGASYTYAQ